MSPFPLNLLCWDCWSVSPHARHGVRLPQSGNLPPHFLLLRSALAVLQLPSFLLGASFVCLGGFCCLQPWTPDRYSFVLTCLHPGTRRLASLGTLIVFWFLGLGESLHRRGIEVLQPPRPTPAVFQILAGVCFSRFELPLPSSWGHGPWHSLALRQLVPEAAGCDGLGWLPMATEGNALSGAPSALGTGSLWGGEAVSVSVFILPFGLPQTLCCSHTFRDLLLSTAWRT